MHEGVNISIFAVLHGRWVYDIFIFIIQSRTSESNVYQFDDIPHCFGRLDEAKIKWLKCSYIYANF